jgi:hypothetical protein
VEQFQLGVGSRDSYRYFVPGGNHGSEIAPLPADGLAYPLDRKHPLTR